MTDDLVLDASTYFCITTFLVLLFIVLKVIVSSLSWWFILLCFIWPIVHIGVCFVLDND